MEKCPKHTTKTNFVMVLLEKANGILIETIVISLMVSIGLLLFFLAGEVQSMNQYYRLCGFTKDWFLKTNLILVFYFI